MTYAQWAIEAFCCTYILWGIDWPLLQIGIAAQSCFATNSRGGGGKFRKKTTAFLTFSEFIQFFRKFLPLPHTHFPELLERKVEKFKKRPSSFVSIRATRVRRRAKMELFFPDSTPRSSSSSIWHHLCAFPIYFEVKITFLKNDSNSCGGCIYVQTKGTAE